MVNTIERQAKLSLYRGKIGNVIDSNQFGYVLVFDYVGKDFSITRGRRVLPLEIKNKEYLVALDLTKQLQRQFKLEGIQNLQVVKGNGEHLQFTTKERAGTTEESKAQPTQAEGQSKLPTGGMDKPKI